MSRQRHTNDPEPNQPRKRVIQRQPRSPEQQAERIVDKELERHEHEMDAEIEHYERMQRMAEKQRKVTELREQAQWSHRAAESAIRHRIEEEEKAKQPKTLEDCNTFQMRALAAMHDVELPSLVGLREQGQPFSFDVWIELLRDAGVDEPLDPDLYNSLPSDRP